MGYALCLLVGIMIGLLISCGVYIYSILHMEDDKDSTWYHIMHDSDEEYEKYLNGKTNKPAKIYKYKKKED